jgi:glycosyltransferase involved in cell wall biosynthesis
MEYAAVGLPCIAAGTTTIREYFTDTMVEFFTPGDADDLARCIRELALDPERRVKLAGRSRAFTERYNWTRLGAAYVELVENLAASRVR